MRKLVSSLVAVLASATVQAAPSYGPGVDTGTLAVQATVVQHCLVDANASLNFNTYDSLVANKSANLDVSGSFFIQCTKNAVPKVALGQGQHYSGARFMSNGSDTLQYELYFDSAGGTAWTTTAMPTLAAAPGIGVAGSDIQVPLYGRVFAGQNPSPGTYQDTVAITVSF